MLELPAWYFLHPPSSWCKAALELEWGAGWKPPGVATKSSASLLLLLIIAVAGFQLMSWENKAVGPEIEGKVLKPPQSPPHGGLALSCHLQFISWRWKMPQREDCSPAEPEESFRGLGGNLLPNLHPLWPQP